MNDLSPTRWQQIDALFAETLSYPRSEQTAVLRERCGTDRALYENVNALLDQVDAAASVLGESITDFAAPVLPVLQAERGAASLPASSGEPRIGPYRLTGELGSGGMATVYLAEGDGDPTRWEVALKLTRNVQTLVHCLRSERQILGALDHPGIVQLYNGGTSADGCPYLVMEYVSGRPIDQYCDEHQLTVPARVELFQTLCEAVEHAHRRCVVHLDLKPSNILITETGTVKLLDFGIATMLDPSFSPSAPRTRASGIMTLEYAAPEQVRGAPVTRATDVYALGVLLYELLTGRRPLDLSGRSSTEAESVLFEQRPDRPSRVVTHPVRRRQYNGTMDLRSPEALSANRRTTPTSLREQLEGPLDTIVLTALRTDPDRRYASASALLDDIHRYRAGQPLAPRPGSRRDGAPAFLYRHRTAIGITLVALVLAGGGAVLATGRAWTRRRPPREA